MVSKYWILSLSVLCMYMPECKNLWTLLGHEENSAIMHVQDGRNSHIAIYDYTCIAIYDYTCIAIYDYTQTLPFPNFGMAMTIPPLQ